MLCTAPVHNGSYAPNQAPSDDPQSGSVSNRRLVYLHNEPYRDVKKALQLLRITQHVVGSTDTVWDWLNDLRGQS